MFDVRQALFAYLPLHVCKNAVKYQVFGFGMFIFFRDRIYKKKKNANPEEHYYWCGGGIWRNVFVCVCCAPFGLLDFIEAIALARHVKPVIGTTVHTHPNGAHIRNVCVVCEISAV